jgi:hypothetical protein
MLDDGMSKNTVPVNAIGTFSSGGKKYILKRRDETARRAVL